MDYQFIWHDGGRAAAGFTGYAGDCAARAISIATGEKYADVYAEITTLQGASPRTGTLCAGTLLKQRGWSKGECEATDELPQDRGVLVLALKGSRSGHLATLVGNTLYDTWDCLLTSDLSLEAYWWHPEFVQSENSSLPKPSVGCRVQSRHDAEFHKVLSRIRKLDATAKNAAATEGEVENALRAIQAMLLKHNLSREDITDDDESTPEGFTNRAIAVNGKNACSWERSLAWYVTEQVFPLVSFYKSRENKRTFYWFYGPVGDVEQCIELFRELLLTIATAATTQYGTFRKSSGASYAEGFVDGLPRSASTPQKGSGRRTSSAGLVPSQAQQLQSVAKDWLREECNVRLVSSSRGYGRFSFDGAAHARGRKDGARHDVGHQPKRLTQRN